MKQIILSALFLVLAACAKSNDTTTTGLSKQINSVWTSSDPAWTMDFTQFTVTTNQTFQVITYYATGGSCTSTAKVTATFDPELQDTDSGTVVLSNSVAGEVVGGMAPCTQLNGAYSYYLLGSDGFLLCPAGQSCLELH